MDVTTGHGAHLLRVLRIDFAKHVLLQFGQPRVRARFVTAALVLDQPAGRHDQRIVLRKIDRLHRLVQGRHAPETGLVVVGRVARHQVAPRRQQRFAVHRHRVGKIPHVAARAGVAIRRAAMADDDADDAAGHVGLPVLAFGLGLLGHAQFRPPAELFQKHVVEFRVSSVEFAPFGKRVVGGQQRHAVVLDTPVGAERQAAAGHAFRQVVQDRRARVLHFRRAPARPRQAVIVALARPRLGQQGGRVEGVLVVHVQLEPLRRAAAVADGPAGAVNFTQDVFDHRLVVHHRDVLAQFAGKAEFFGEQVDDFLVRLAFEQRQNHPLAPLDAAVRRRHRAGTFELGGGRQQVDAVLAAMHRRRHGRVGIDHHQQVEQLHGRLHVGQPGLAVGGVAPVQHGAQVGRLVDVLVFFKHAVEPA